MSLYESLSRVLAPFASRLNGLLTGYDGTTYSSPAEAVRTQISDLHVLIGDIQGDAKISGSAVRYEGDLTATNMQGAVDELSGDVADVNGRLQQKLTGRIRQAELVSGAFTTHGMSTNLKSLTIKYPVYVTRGTRLAFFAGSLYHRVYELSDTSLSGESIITYEGWSAEENYIAKNDCYIAVNFATASTYEESSFISVTDFLSEYYVKIDEIADVVERFSTEQIRQAQIVNGGFNSSVGVNSDKKRIRLKNVMFVEKGTKIVFSTGELYHLIYLLSDTSLSTESIILNEGWATESCYIVKKDCYIMIVFATSDVYESASNITIENFLQNYYVQTVKTVYPVVTIADDPSVNTKVKDYCDFLETSTDIESFMFFTDDHYLEDVGGEANFESALLEMGRVYNNAPVDFCVFGGDIITSNPANALFYLTEHDRQCRAVFGSDRYFSVVGNHEYKHYNTQYALSENAIVNALFREEGKAYYHKKKNHTTFYFLNTGNNRNSDGTYNVPMDLYKWEQIDWLAQRLVEDDSSHSVIVLHIITNNSEEYPEFVLFAKANELCNAYNNKSEIILNSKTYDFSNCTGKVELFLGGHMHKDINFVKNSIPCVIRRNANQTRTTFDLVFCDWYGRKIYFKRFGVGNDLTINL